MKNNYSTRIFILFMITYFLLQPLHSKASILERNHYMMLLPHNKNENLTLETDWKNLIGLSFVPYISKLRNQLTRVDSEDLLYNIYQYKDSHIYVCKETLLIHHVIVRDPHIPISDTYVGMLPKDIEHKHGQATVSQETFATKEWIIQYAYDKSSNYNVATRSLTYTSSSKSSPITEISYGYILPLLPDKVGKVSSNKDAEKHLQGMWSTKDSNKFIFNNNRLFDSFATENNPQSSKNYFILSPNEMNITHTRGDNYTSIITLRFIFNKDFSKLYFFSTDEHGIPIVDTIDEWIRQP